jgi:hypothetical protein
MLEIRIEMTGMIECTCPATEVLDAANLMEATELFQRRPKFPSLRQQLG